MSANASPYRQVFVPRLRSFSAFAAGFSYLSILTGVFQYFYLGFGAGGPAFFWTWPLVFAGQLLVALCFAELAARFPLAGGVYQWSKYAGSWAVGWLTGWIYLASYIVTLAAVALALPAVLPQLSSRFQVLADPTHNSVLLGVALIALTTLINAAGVRLMAAVNNVGVFTELIGAILLVILLAVHAVRSPAVVFDTLGHGAGEPFGYLGPFLLSALMASYVMYGFDTAGALAEETREPRRRIPRAILQALAAAALLGGLLLLAGLTAAPNLHDPQLGKTEGGLPLVITQVLGETLGAFFLADVAFAMIVCTLAVQAGAVRLVFAMARDNNLPGSHALASLRGQQAPVVPTIVVGMLAAIVLIAFANSAKLYETVGAIALGWANLAYLLVTLPLLLRRLRGKWREPTGPNFGLGRWGTPVNLLAVLWSVALIVNVIWPRPEVFGAIWYERYAGPVGTAALVAAGVIYYALVQRHRTGVLEEHRAEGATAVAAAPAAD